jgi:hypothetical protein
VRAPDTVAIGTDSTEDMFNPDADVFLTPAGRVAGGHGYLLVGIWPRSALLFQNSWSAGWGQRGTPR